MRRICREEEVKGTETEGTGYRELESPGIGYRRSKTSFNLNRVQGHESNGKRSEKRLETAKACPVTCPL
jgi:hypothetical protein